MTLRYLTLSFLFVFQFESFSQAPIHYHHNTFWGRLGIADNFTDKLKWEVYYQNRTQNDPNAQKANIFRYHQTTSYTAALYYKWTQNLRLTFTPFVYFNSIGLIPQGDNGNRGVKEYRWMFQIEHSSPIGIFNVNHRYTAEYRTRDLFVAGDYVSNFRFRYRGQIEHTLAKWEHPVTFTLYDEVFFEFGGAVKGSPAILNQNRLFAGFTYRVVEHVKLNLGYVYLVQERMSGKIFDYSNVLSVAITFEGLLTPKQKSKENITDSQPGD